MGRKEEVLEPEEGEGEEGRLNLPMENTERGGPRGLKKIVRGTKIRRAILGYRGGKEGRALKRRRLPATMNCEARRSSTVSSRPATRICPSQTYDVAVGPLSR